MMLSTVMRGRVSRGAAQQMSSSYTAGVCADVPGGRDLV